MFDKEEELKSLINNIQPNIVHLQETDVNNYDSQRPFHFPGFSTIVGRGEKKRVMSFVKLNTFRSYVSEISNKGQQIWIKLELPNGKTIKTCNFYREWNMNQEEDINDLMEKIEADKSSTTIIVGDWNLDLQKSSNYAHKTMAQSTKRRIQEAGFKILSPGPTWRRVVQGEVRTSSLDWAAYKGKYQPSIRKYPSCSDHDAVIIDLPMELHQRPPTKILRRNLKKINIQHFHEDLQYFKLWKNFQAQSTDQKAKTLSTNILKVLDKHAPNREVKAKARPRPKPSPKLLQLRKNRDIARKNGWGKTYKKLRNQCNNLTKRETITHNGKRIKRDPLQVWTIIEELFGKNEVAKIQIEAEGQYLTEDKVPQAFNTFFLNKVRKLRDSLPPREQDPLDTTRRLVSSKNIDKGIFSFTEVTPHDILRTIKKLKKSTAQDVEGLNSEIIKLCGHSITTPMSMLINQIIRECTFPDKWKSSRVVPIHKKKSRTNVENYRPIHLVCTLSKILEAILCEQLSEYLEKNGIIPNEQHGYRKNHSTTTAINMAADTWTEAINQGKKAAALLFDLSAAFDLVNPDILMEKMELFGVNKSAQRLLRSYMTGRNQTVQVGDHLSQQGQIEIGSPQGSGLSPLLFLALVSDLPMATSGAKIVTYADDTTAIISANNTQELTHTLEKTIEEVATYMKNSGLALNPEKTGLLVFKSKGDITVQYNGTILQESPHQKLLGVIISSQNNWNKHIEELLGELNSRVGILRRLKRHLPKESLLNLIDPLILSKIRYAMAVYCDPTTGWRQGECHNSTIQDLQIKVNNAIRVCLGLALKDRVPIDELLATAKVPSVLQICVELHCMEAWKALGSGQEHRMQPSQNPLRQHHLRLTRSKARGDIPGASIGTSENKLAKIYNCLPQQIRNATREKEAKVSVAKNYKDILSAIGKVGCFASYMS